MKTTNDDASDSAHPARVAALRAQLGGRSPGRTLGLVKNEFEGQALHRLLAAAGLRGELILAVAELQWAQGPDIAWGPSSQVGLDVRHSSAAQLLTEVIAPDLIVAPNVNHFHDLLDAVSRSPEENDPPSADILVLADDASFCQPAYWRNPDSFVRVIYPCDVVVGEGFVLFSPQGAPAALRYGLMTVSAQTDGLSFWLQGSSSPNARTGPTVALARSLLAQVGVERGDSLVFQYDDWAHHDVPSVAYGRLLGTSAAVRLIADPVFIESHGYQASRQAALDGGLPSWDDRRDMVLWRGSTTTNLVAIDGGRVDRLEAAPRVAMCLALSECAAADAAIMSSWGPLEQHLGLTQAQVHAWLADRRILRPSIPMLDHAAYRLLIDIDGVASAWSFFEKLLLGACVLKVGSPFEQWFYEFLEPGRDYIPIKPDLSDLTETIAWCLRHPNDTRAVAERGQRVALQHTFEAGWLAALESTRRALSAK
jgi:hypothetical protein